MGKLKTISKLAQRRQQEKSLKKKGLGHHKHHKNAKNRHEGFMTAQKVEPLIKKLGSNAANDKSMAINGITLLCDTDPELRRLFLKSNLIEILITKLIHDPSDDIVVDSYGLLRNLMIDEGYSLCVHLWRKNLWTSIQLGFEKAEKALMDNSAKDEAKRLLVNYIENLVGCTDCFTSELPIDLFEKSLLPKLESDGVLDFIFKLVSDGSDKHLLLIALEFIYDMATTSSEFIGKISRNDDYIKVLDEASTKDLSRLSKTYLIGILLQILEVRGEIDYGTRLTSKILKPLYGIYQTDIDLDSTVKELNLPHKDNMTVDERRHLAIATESFNAIDLHLDLYTTVLEIVGEHKAREGKPASANNECVEFFNTSLQSFLSDLFDSKFHDQKLLPCTNNLVLLNQSFGISNDSYSQFLQKVYHCLTSRFTEVLNEDSVSDSGLEEVNGILKFSVHFMDMNDKSLWNVDKDRVVKLIQYSQLVFNGVKSDSIDAGIFLDFNQYLIAYLSKIAKNCGSDAITGDVTKFLVDEKFVKYFEWYKQFKTPFELHKKLGYLIEETLNSVVNAIFDVYDDEYQYNRPIFHEGGLLQLLIDRKPDFKKVYKAVDKNVNKVVRHTLQETLENLTRFIAYKHQELQQ